MTRIGILVSGRGSNMEALTEAAIVGKVSYEVEVVVSDKKKAPAIKKAQDLGVPVEVVRRRSFASKEDFETRIIEVLKSYDVDLVVLAGFMRVLGPTFLSEFKGRTLNIHPSLLPAFPGLDAQAQAVDYGVKVSGLTIHFVDEGVDTGPIIFQFPVKVEDDDTAEVLAARILKYEHDFYPQVVDAIARGLYEVQGRRVKLLTRIEGA